MSVVNKNTNSGSARTPLASSTISGGSSGANSGANTTGAPRASGTQPFAPIADVDAREAALAFGDHVSELDNQFVMRPWPHPQGEPVIIDFARDCVVTDVHGKEYLDFTAGYFVNNAGHCHPRIVDAAMQQMSRVLQVSGKHGSVAAARLAAKLVSIAPKGLDKVLFSTGGSESNEFALKIARQATGRSKVAYVENGYHGLTLGALEVTANDRYRETAGKPVVTHAYQIPTPYTYRSGGPQNRSATEAYLTDCLNRAEAAFDANPDTAALIAEPMQAVGGIAPPQQWWTRIARMLKERGILLILDEVQTGLGRTGLMFASEHYGITPDIMTVGKGVSGGVGSLAATMTTTALAQKFFGGTTPTSGGNAVSAAAGIAMIDILQDEGLLENSATMGRYFTEAAFALNDPWIGDVRFVGLLGGIELVLDRSEKTILPKAAVAMVKDYLHEHGMLITISGMHGNYLRLQPPLTVKAHQIDQLLATLSQALDHVRRSRNWAA